MFLFPALASALSTLPVFVLCYAFIESTFLSIVILIVYYVLSTWVIPAIMAPVNAVMWIVGFIVIFTRPIPTWMKVVYIAVFVFSCIRFFYTLRHPSR